MRTYSAFKMVAIICLTLASLESAQAAGGNGLAINGSLGAAGGARASSASGAPSLASGVELGVRVENGTWFVGAFYDRFTASIWQAGITARKFVGSSRFFWGQIKVSMSGMAGMIGDDAQVKEWSGYLNGGLAAGVRVPLGSLLSLQPFAGFDSFLPVTGTSRVYTSPTESELRLTTSARAFIPMAGVRAAWEF